MKWEKLKEIVTQYPWLMSVMPTNKGPESLSLNDPKSLLSEDIMKGLHENLDLVRYIAIRPYTSMKLDNDAFGQDSRKMDIFSTAASFVTYVFGHKMGDERFTKVIMAGPETLREMLLRVQNNDIQPDAVVVFHFLVVDNFGKFSLGAYDAYLLSEDFKISKKSRLSWLPFLRSKTQVV